MAEKQDFPADQPPPYPGISAPYPPPPQGPMGVGQNPGMNPTVQQPQGTSPGYPTMAQPQAYADPGYPIQQPPPYGAAAHAYPTDPKTGQPVYPVYPAGYQGYPSQPGYPAGVPTTMTHHQQVTVVAATGPLQPQVIPPDYAGLAWFSCLFCFCPLGLIAISRSNEAKRAIQSGNFPLAAQMGMEARRYANYAIGTGITLFTVFIVIRIALSVAF